MHSQTKLRKQADLPINFPQNINKGVQKKPSSIRLTALVIGLMTGFEPATSGTTIQYSNQLSYIHRLRVQIYKIFYSLNLLWEIIPGEVEERPARTVPLRSYPHSA